MPLHEGSDRATIQQNIREMVASGHPHDPSVAAALHQAYDKSVDVESVLELSPSHLSPESLLDWLLTYCEALNETGNVTAAKLAAYGRVTKRRLIGMKSMADGEEPIIAGWGLLFTDPTDLDLQGTFFDDDVALYLDIAGKGLFYDHGQDSTYGSKPIGERTLLQVYPRGIWVEHRLYTDHPLFNRTFNEVQRGELAYSSDSVAHLAEPGFNPNTGELSEWPIYGWSVTNAPAEPALGPVSLKQFTAAMKSHAVARQANREADTALTNAYLSNDSGVTSSMNEILAKLAAALGLPPTASPEQIEEAVESAIASWGSNPDDMTAAHAAMGMDGEPNADVMAEKVRGLYKAATAPAPEPPPAPAPQPEPPVKAMPAARNWGALKDAFAIAGKSMVYDDMPYAINANGSSANGLDKNRFYSTKGAPNQNFGIKPPGVSEVFQDMVLVSRGQQPRTFRSAKAMSYATGPAGGYVLEQEVSDQILDPLRAEAVVLKLGARQEDMDGIQIKQVPAMQSAPSAYWPGEAQTVVDSQPAYRMITLVPKPLAVLVQRPFNFFKNMTPRAESQLKAQIQKSLTLAIDLAALTGTGGASTTPNTGSQPVGLLNISGVTNTSLATDGRQPTLLDLTNAEKRVDAANIPPGGSRGWTFHSNVKHVFTSMTDSTGQPIFRESWKQGEDKELLGSPYEVSNQISTTVTTGANSDTTYIFYGDWQYMVVGMTTTVELVLDQTYAASLLQGLLAYVYVDVQVDYAQAFQILSGVRTG